MNIHHPTAAEQARKAKELKDKFFGKGTVANIANDALASARRTIEKQAARIAEMAATIDRQAEQIAKMTATIKEQSTRSEEIVATISALQSMLISDARKDGLNKGPRSVVDRVLSKRHPGVTFEHIIEVNRSANIVAARMDCILAVHERFPAMHPKDIASFFKRDRTTILSALGKKKRPDFKAAQNDRGLF